MYNAGNKIQTHALHVGVITQQTEVDVSSFGLLMLVRYIDTNIRSLLYVLFLRLLPKSQNCSCQQASAEQEQFQCTINSCHVNLYIIKPMA